MKVKVSIYEEPDLACMKFDGKNCEVLFEHNRAPENTIKIYFDEDMYITAEDYNNLISMVDDSICKLICTETLMFLENQIQNFLYVRAQTYPSDELRGHLRKSEYFDEIKRI